MRFTLARAPGRGSLLMLARCHQASTSRIRQPRTELDDWYGSSRSEHASGWGGHGSSRDGCMNLVASGSVPHPVSHPENQRRIGIGVWQTAPLSLTFQE